MSPHPGRPSLRPSPGSVTIEHESGGRRVLCLSGDVDSAVVAEYERRQGSVSVIVDAIDAGAVSFLGSVGRTVMLRCAEAAVAAVGRIPELRAASGPVDRLLQVAGLAAYFPRAGRATATGGGIEPAAGGRTEVASRR